MDVEIIKKVFQQQNRSAYSLWIFHFTSQGFDQIEAKHNLCCRKDCMKMFCTSLREKNNDFEKKKMLPLSKN